MSAMQRRHLRELTLVVDDDLLDDDAEKLELMRSEVGHRALAQLGWVVRSVELGAEDEVRVLVPVGK